MFSKDTDNIKFLKDYIEATYKIYNGQLNGILKIQNIYFYF